MNLSSTPRALLILLITADLLSISSSRAADPSEALGVFESHTDVGSPAKAGAVAYDAATRTYTLRGAGTNMWAQRDEFHFAWKKMSGDFTLRAHIKFIGEGVDPHRKIGWMIRQSLDAGSPYADAAVHGDGLTSLQYRRTADGVTEQVESPITEPDVIQLEKRGTTYILSAAKEGAPLTSVQLDNLDLGDGDLYVGLFICSHNAEVIEEAVFTNVRITGPR